MSAHWRLVALCTAVLVVASACSDQDRLVSPERPDNPESPAPGGGRGFDASRVGLRLTPVVDGLESPLAVASPADGSDRLFVAEQGGRIRIVRDGRLLPAPFLDISNLIVAGGEQGLLGLAFHPDFKSNGMFYVNYTDTEGDTVVAEYRVSGADPNRADPASARPLLTQAQPFPNHNGGGLAFGDDGYLYIALGDGGSGGDPQGNGKNLGTFLGKILRIDVDGRSGDLQYALPADNPFVDRSGARPEIWAYGLRNPFRFSFDRASGDLWIGDVGQSELEEIDFAAAGEGGLNFGWNVMEGDACFDPPSGCDREGLEQPVAVYSHDFGCSVIGGNVYRGSELKAMRGGYIYGDYCSGNIWVMNARARSSAEPRLILESGLAISSFGEDEAGELYITELSGRLLRVEAR